MATSAKEKAEALQEENASTFKEFRELVNMSPATLEAWLKTEHSKEVGWGKEENGGESVGHESGRHIIKILHTKKDDLSEADYKHIHKVVGYIKRHLAQRLDGDISETRWAYSLKNWGHDPTKD